MEIKVNAKNLKWYAVFRCKVFTAPAQQMFLLLLVIQELSPKALPVSHHLFLTSPSIMHSCVIKHYHKTCPRNICISP